MANTRVLLLALAVGAALAAGAEGQVARGPDTVLVQTGALNLRALLCQARVCLLLLVSARGRALRRSGYPQRDLMDRALADKG